MVSVVFIFLIVQLLLSGLIFGLISWQRYRNNIKTLIYFEIIFGLAFLRSIIEFVTVIILNLSFPWIDLHFIAYAAAIIAFYLFAEYVNAMRPAVLRISVIFLLFGGFLFFFLLSIAIGFDNTLTQWPFNHPRTFFELPLDLLQFAIFSYVFYVFIKMRGQANNQQQRRSTTFGAIATFVMIIAAILEVSEFFTSIDISSAITTVPAFILFFIVYITNPRFSYASPIKVFRILVFVESGPVVLNLDIDNKYRDGEAIDTQLIGGMVISINSMFREITHDEQDNLEDINLGNTSFMFHKHNSIFAVIEAERATRVLRRALIDFSKDVYQEYADFFDNHALIPRDKTLDNLVSKYFPFYTPDNQE